MPIISLAVLLSIALHAIPLLFLGIDGTGGLSAAAPPPHVVPPLYVRLVKTTLTVIDQNKPPENTANAAPPFARESAAANRPVAQSPMAALALHADMPDETFVPASELQRPAEMLLPYDADLIPGAARITGRLRLELKVDRRGKVREIRVIDAVDPGNAMEKVIVPWLESSPFQPGRKDGVAVNSLLKIDLTLSPPAPIDSNFTATRSPGQPLWMDDKGKFINDAPLVRAP